MNPRTLTAIAILFLTVFWVGLLCVARKPPDGIDPPKGHWQLAYVPWTKVDIPWSLPEGDLRELERCIRGLSHEELDEYHSRQIDQEAFQRNMAAKVAKRFFNDPQGYRAEAGEALRTMSRQ